MSIFFSMTHNEPAQWPGRVFDPSEAGLPIHVLNIQKPIRYVPHGSE